MIENVLPSGENIEIIFPSHHLLLLFCRAVSVHADKRVQYIRARLQ